MTEVIRYLTLSSLQSATTSDYMGSATNSGTAWYTVRNYPSGYLVENLSVKASNYFSHSDNVHIPSVNWVWIDRTYVSFFLDENEVSSDETIIGAKISLYITKSVVDFKGYTSRSFRLFASRDKEDNIYHHMPMITEDYYIGNYDIFYDSFGGNIPNGLTGSLYDITLSGELLEELNYFGYFKYTIITDLDANPAWGIRYNQTFSVNFENYSYSSPPVMVLELLNEEYTGLIETTSGRGQKCLTLRRDI